MKNKHPCKVLINPFDGSKCAIDEELVPFITEIWKNGIRTNFCCQNSCSATLPVETNGLNQHPYVMFRNAKAFQKLVDLLNQKASVSEFHDIFSDNSHSLFKFRNFVQRMSISTKYGKKNPGKDRYNVAPVMHATLVGYETLVTILKRK